MIRRFMVGVTTLLVTACSVVTPIQAKATNTSSNYAFFFTPHQDDEVLSMGTAIKAMVNSKHRTYVVLLTDGSSSWYCLRVFATKAQCVAERDMEFINGVRSMGAIPIIPRHRATDGKLTVAYAQHIFSQYHTIYPTAMLRTMSQYDKSPDHANLGTALYNLHLFSLSQWYIKQTERATCKGIYTARFNQVATLNKYPFGHISVPYDFAVAADPKGNIGKYYTH